MDLSKLNLTEQADQGSTLEVIHPITGDVLLDSANNPVTITVFGANSTKMRTEMRERARKQLAAKKPVKMDLEESEKVSAELLASNTISWNGLEEDGVRLACTFENAVRIYSKYSWLRGQVDTFMSENANFYKA